jgi:hypothetical protein
MSAWWRPDGSMDGMQNRLTCFRLMGPWASRGKSACPVRDLVAAPLVESKFCVTDQSDSAQWPGSGRLAWEYSAADVYVGSP